MLEIAEVKLIQKTFNSEQRAWACKLKNNWIVLISRAESSQQNLLNKPVIGETILQIFLVNQVKTFRYQHSVAVSGKLGAKVLVFDDVLSSHGLEIYDTTSLVENSAIFQIKQIGTFTIIQDSPIWLRSCNLSNVVATEPK